MVSQAASQTRFRALKHESGIAGSATIIVRVIACFQPLQDCQSDCCSWMEKDFGSWFYHQHSDRPPLNLNTLCGPFNLGQQNAISTYTSPLANVVSTNATLQGFPFYGVPQTKASQPIEPRDWFYGLPHFHQASTPVSNSILKERIYDGPYKNREVVAPNSASECAQKRFLVFDQSGDQTTLILSSKIGVPVQCPPAPWGPKLDSGYDLNKIELGTGRDTIRSPGPILTDEGNENHGDDMGSEMHEDTEELNALLYSDDEYGDGDYSEDGEEASTGHSPSVMTLYDKREWFEKSDEEVASSDWPTKKRKLFDGGYDVPPLMNTAASSVKPQKCFDYEDDAQSSCADGKNSGLGESGLFSGNKRSRTDTIRETVSKLQNIIPVGKGKDAIVILDDAINFLISLKHKAEALGVDAL
ncbi:unnamed protein product [Camellia sinensis]